MKIAARLLLAFAAFAIPCIESGGYAAIPEPGTAPQPPWHYADVADVYGSAPIVLRARIVAAVPLPSPPTADGMRRFYIEGIVITLIRGNGGVPPKLAWVTDVPSDSRDRALRLKKRDVLLAAVPVPGRPAQIQLIAPDAQQPWTPALEEQVRAVVATVMAPDAPPVITRVVSAYHSPGTVPGEGETQIFLSTANRVPVSLSVLRRPGEPPRWAFAQGEIVDEAAGTPSPGSLAWYRLACFLPPRVPDSALADLSPADADAARTDYVFVIAQLGPCPRVRPGQR